jgi:TPR repeat protein
LRYKDGLGVPKDLRKAMECFKISADGNDSWGFANYDFSLSND